MKRMTLAVVALVLGSLGPLVQAGPSHADPANLGLQVDPLPTSVRSGAALYVTGTAPLLRTAVLQVQRGGRWVAISQPSATAAAFRFKVPTNYYGIRTLRVASPGTLVLGEIDSDSQTVTVKPPYVPLGQDYQHVLVGNGYRWNPCSAIRYRVNFAGMPKSNLKLIKQAIARVTAATGLRFSYAGTSKVVPFSNSWNRRVPSSGLYISFATAKNVPGLKGIAGLGGEGSLATTAAGSHRIASGGVSLEKGWWRRLKAGLVNGPARGTLLMHELGHAMGLMHDASKSQVMYPVVGPWSRPRYGAGDLSGLQQLGADNGCLP